MDFLAKTAFFFSFRRRTAVCGIFIVLRELKQVHLNGRTACATGGFYSVPKLKKPVEEISERHGLIILKVIHEKV